jgi:peptide/nickel transport system substrate-binding protein
VPTRGLHDVRCSVNGGTHDLPEAPIGAGPYKFVRFQPGIELVLDAFADYWRKTRVRTMERAAFLSAWRDKKLKGVFVGAAGSAGNASTRIEASATGKGLFSYGTIPEVENLFARQIQEMDRKKREEMLHQIQRLFFERVVLAGIWENGFIRADGSRVEESGLTLIQSFPYSGPLEDMRLKKQ